MAMNANKMEVDNENKCDIGFEMNSSQHAPSQLCNAGADEGGPAAIDIHIEACLKPGSQAPTTLVQEQLGRLLQDRGCITYQDGPISLEGLEDAGQDCCAVLSHVDFAHITDCDHNLYRIGGLLMGWQYTLAIHVYSLNAEEEPAEDDEGEDGVASFREWALPGSQFKGLWPCLYYDTSIKQRLLRYASSALLFAERGVSTDLVSWNRVVLLHGPPGTGKTSLCKALAHKLAVRFSHRFRMASLVEVNAHSLFSKFFSESGKQVQKLFQKITELLEDSDVLVFVLIDEIESLAAARKAAAGGSEPSDAVRAVNALLTNLDALKRFPNSMVLSTSNLSAAIDVAFVDRADIKAYIGPPTLAARYEIMRSSLIELSKRGIVTGEAASLLWPYVRLAPFVSPASELGPQQAKAATPPAHATSQKASTQQEGRSGSCLPLPGGRWLVLAQDPEPDEHQALMLSANLLATAASCDGLSGRALRKLPFLAHAAYEGTLSLPCSCPQYMTCMRAAAAKELEDRADIEASG